MVYPNGNIYINKINKCKKQNKTKWGYQVSVTNLEVMQSEHD
jgi:hypothetical protein